VEEKFSMWGREKGPEEGDLVIDYFIFKAPL